MKLTIEVDLPDKSVEDVQKFVISENELNDNKPEDINAVEVFVALYMSGKIGYTVTKAEMTDKRCEHKEFAEGYCAEMGCSNYYSHKPYDERCEHQPVSPYTGHCDEASCPNYYSIDEGKDVASGDAAKLG